MSRLKIPPGVLPAAVGGLTGAVGGVFGAVFVFDRVAVGDLSDIGTGLLLLVGGLVLGSSAGTYLALIVARQTRPIATALAVGPLMLVAVIASFMLVERLDEITNSAGLFGIPLLVGLGFSAIWLARALTVTRVSDGRSGQDD
ncbi:MAG: hypothetical protein WAL25_02140 [Acidimicrobiia bacterium]